MIASRIRELFQKHADAERAVAMASYMKNSFIFYGISAPQRRELLCSVLQEASRLSIDNSFDIAEELYQHAHRELHYAACDIVVRSMTKKAVSSLLLAERERMLSRTEQLLLQHQWWDTVDILAPRIAGAMLLGHNDLLQRWTNRWIQSDDFWLQRSAILCQLHHKNATQVGVLFRLILERADSKEFFVRKAAGWALRNYSYTNPTAVRSFLDAHPELSTLTRREGGKYC
jgi:3-methyladenine DNA glycosylase AlkD